jgi:hypothetical protein
LYHEDIWDEGIRFNVQPISNSVRILIRPDVAKKEVKRILRKAIKIIDEDKYDWPQETDNYLKLLHGEMANRKSRR